MEYRWEIRKSESTYQGQYTCEWIVDVVSGCSRVVAIWFDTEAKAQEYVKTHDAKEQYKRIHREAAEYMKKNHIVDECDIDDGKLHPITNGYIVEKVGEQEEWERF